MRALELFAGAGGLGIGVGRAGFKPVRVVEWDRWCCDTIRENRAAGIDAVADWPDPIEADAREVSFRDLAGRVELVTGGPPCQPFSLGGKHRGRKDSRDMWPQAVRAVREIGPKAFIFENVKGLTRSNFATYFAYVLHQLRYPEMTRGSDESWGDHLGRLELRHGARGAVADGLVYNVLPRVLNAADYGVPQKRERVVFVGFRHDLGIEWEFPRPTHSLDALLWDQIHTADYWDENRVPARERAISPRLRGRAKRLARRPDRHPWRTVRQAMADLPDPEKEPERAKSWLNHRFQPGARSYPGHTGSPMDEPAKALKAGVHGVPGGENMLLRADGDARYFTVRESARLQSFPDSYRFHGAWSECMRQLGNAVPVDLAAAIARDVRARLSSLEESGKADGRPP